MIQELNKKLKNMTISYMLRSVKELKNLQEKLNRIQVEKQAR
jgi:hypothetical protein